MTIVGRDLVICESFSELDDWSTGVNQFIFEFPKVEDYAFSYMGQTWTSLEAYGIGFNYANSFWTIKYTLTTLNRSDTGLVNSSPRVTMAPVVSIPLDSVYNISIPILDPDDDIVKCRWADSLLNECGGYFNCILIIRIIRILIIDK